MARLTKSLIKKYNSYLYIPEPVDYYSYAKKTVEYTSDGGELGTAIVTAYKKRDVIVIIDCGHGRSTAGKKSPWSMHGVRPEIPFEEWQWNRECGKLLGQKLEQMGITVKYTVDPDDDTDVRLTTRYQIANKIKQQNPDKHCLLISVHANAAGSGREWMNARGWCAYTTKGQNNSDKLADCIYDAAEAVLPLDDIKIRYDKTDGDKDYESNFTIIYGSNMPAVLVENLFYDNVDDCEFLTSDYGKDILSTVMAQGIFDFITKVWKL